MKFVSALLIAMIAMMLVVPALGCEGVSGSCKWNSHCCSKNCVLRGPTQGFCRPKQKASLSQVRKSLLSALVMIEDN